MDDAEGSSDDRLRWRVWVALGLIACVPRDCGEETMQPCLSPVEDVLPPLQPPAPPPVDTHVAPCLSVSPPLEACLSLAPEPEPAPPSPAPDPQGRTEDPDAVRERVLASDRLPEDVVARLRAR